MVLFQILVFVAFALFVGGSCILWWSQTTNSHRSPKKTSASTTILPTVSSPMATSPDCSTCPTDYSAAVESFPRARSPDYNLQPWEEAGHHDIVESLRSYEEKVKEVDKMNRIVNDLIQKERCPDDYFEEDIMNLNKMNEMLGMVISAGGMVISAGLEQARVLGHKDQNLLEQVNNHFMRINQEYLQVVDN